MKKCFICETKIPKKNGDLCNACLEFFKWKYGKKFKRRLRDYRKYYEKNKLSRRYTMDSYKCSCGAYTTNEDGICDMCENLLNECEEESGDSFSE